MGNGESRIVCPSQFLSRKLRAVSAPRVSESKELRDLAPSLVGGLLLALAHLILHLQRPVRRSKQIEVLPNPSGLGEVFAPALRLRLAEYLTLPRHAYAAKEGL